MNGFERAMQVAVLDADETLTGHQANRIDVAVTVWLKGKV
jgi:hypothetical protein